MKKWILIGIVLWVASASAAQVRVEKASDGWRLLVDGKPFFVKGMCYTPAKVGESGYNNTLRDWMVVDDDKDGRIDVAYQSWVDENRNNRKDPEEKEIGDFELLRAMGCNAIRIYHHPTSKSRLHSLNREHLAFSHAPNKKLLRELHRNFGIWVMMGDFLGAYTIGSGAPNHTKTDYRSPEQRRNMMQNVKDMILEFKDEPYILFWALGNENNYPELTQTNCAEDPISYAKFVNSVAKWIHAVDPEHPVCLVNGETQFLNIYARHAPAVDIFGVNSYPAGPDFGMLWYKVAKTYDKPVVLAEFGDCIPQVDADINESLQAQVYRNLWQDIVDHSSGRNLPGNAIGGFVFEWVDNWWQDGDSLVHNDGPGHHLREWQGICSQGSGNQSPLLRQMRKAYYVIQASWTATNE